MHVLKMSAAGIWICAVSIGAAYVSSSALERGKPVLAREDIKAVLSFRSKDVAIAVFEGGKVTGYFTTRIVCDVVDAPPQQELEGLLIHALHQAVYRNHTIRYDGLTEADLQTLADAVTGSLAQGAGHPAVSHLTFDEPGFLKRI